MALTRGSAVGAPARLDPFPAVRTEIDDHPALAGTLLRLLQDQRADLANRLVTGQPQTFDEYRNLVGKVEGLDIAIAACKAAHDKLRA